MEIVVKRKREEEKRNERRKREREKKKKDAADFSIYKYIYREICMLTFCMCAVIALTPISISQKSVNTQNTCTQKRK